MLCVWLYLFIMSGRCWYKHDSIPAAAVLCQEGGAQQSYGFWVVDHDIWIACVCVYGRQSQTLVYRERQITTRWQCMMILQTSVIDISSLSHSWCICIDMLKYFQTDVCWPATLRGVKRLKQICVHTFAQSNRAADVLLVR